MIKVEADKSFKRGKVFKDEKRRESYQKRFYTFLKMRNESKSFYALA